MDFFGIGPLEVLLIVIVALIIVGPGKVAEVAKTLGKTVRAIKRAGTEFTAGVTRELEATEQKSPPAPPEKAQKTADAAIPPPPGQTETGPADTLPAGTEGTPPVK
ncbi:MAG: hypothetical protein A2Y90_01595 [Chloroflexi bacterium RBG_13_52_12]|nr:MAG: hypothetical protein A2Y90_01595 [Chloroflexi bacterium RBG_13_52_12]